jgi:hypothetical protein
VTRTPTGHVNVSPKGVAGTFKVIDDKTFMYQVRVPLRSPRSGFVQSNVLFPGFVWFRRWFVNWEIGFITLLFGLDLCLTVETIAHLRENGRITVMFQEFEGAPRICRLFGTGVDFANNAVRTLLT